MALLYSALIHLCAHLSTRPSAGPALNPIPGSAHFALPSDRRLSVLPRQSFGPSFASFLFHLRAFSLYCFADPVPHQQLSLVPYPLVGLRLL